VVLGLCLQFLKSFSRTCNCYVDEFVLGGYEQEKLEHNCNAKKKKATIVIQITDDDKAKRMYAMKIADFFARSLQYVFINHISRKVRVTTDK